MKKRFFIVLGILGALAIISGFFFRVEIKESVESFSKLSLPEPKAVTEFQKQESAPTTTPAEISLKKPSTLGASEASAKQLNRPKGETLNPKPSTLAINLNIPFASQAPFGNWDLPYQEACEEAAAIMVHRYFSGEPLDPATMDGELKKLIAWEEKTFGYYKDTTAEEIARMLREYFGHSEVEVQYDFTIEDVKAALQEGHPVILPAAGRLLPNPYFRDPGPVYHALVVKGFIGEKIITNDPGTRRGKDFLYDPVALLNAVHDWNEENILKGRKVMIIVRE
ncbi:C39 family peptidase [Candidatus Peregrinibacteria bacterium]|nr:C39 family peptidase [Candidatus Peregrinibacteria bacterium]